MLIKMNSKENKYIYKKKNSMNNKKFDKIISECVNKEIKRTKENKIRTVHKLIDGIIEGRI